MSKLFDSGLEKRWFYFLSALKIEVKRNRNLIQIKSGNQRSSEYENYEPDFLLLNNHHASFMEVKGDGIDREYKAINLAASSLYEFGIIARPDGVFSVTGTSSQVNISRCSSCQHTGFLYTENPCPECFSFEMNILHTPETKIVDFHRGEFNIEDNKEETSDVLSSFSKSLSDESPPKFNTERPKMDSKTREKLKSMIIEKDSSEETVNDDVNNVSRNSLLSCDTQRLRAEMKSITDDDILDNWKLMISKLNGESSTYIYCNAELREKILNVKKIMPNMNEVITYVLRTFDHAFAIASLNNENSSEIPFKINKPILLIGKPGTGKSLIGKKIAKAIDAPYRTIDFGSSACSFSICGSEKNWKSAACGGVISAMTERTGGIGNPFIIIDEIEKSGVSYDPSLALGSLLERESAKEFVDLFLGVPVDASGVNFILTANSYDGIPSHILDRVKVFEIEPPSVSDIENIIMPNLLRDEMDASGFQSIDGKGFDLCLRWAKNMIKGNRKTSVREVGRIVDDTINKLIVDINNNDRWAKSYGNKKSR